MSIIVPTERRIICSNDESYSLPINILGNEHTLSLHDEDLIAEMAKFRPRTRLREGDFVLLTSVPHYLKYRRILPRCWKVRFVVTRWAYELMSITLQHGGTLTLDHAKQQLERFSRMRPQDVRTPMIFAHGYPHGQYPDSAAWLPWELVRRTTFRELAMPWPEIVEEAGANYLGYDSDKLPTRFVFDVAPDNYAHGDDIGRPFRAEEPLVHTLHYAGLDEMLDLPFIVGERQRIREIDRDHDIFADPHNVPEED
jgi:hypothetical protein